MKHSLGSIEDNEGVGRVELFFVEGEGHGHIEDGDGLVLVPRVRDLLAAECIVQKCWGSDVWDWRPAEVTI